MVHCKNIVSLDALAESDTFDGWSSSKAQVFPVYFERELRMRSKAHKSNLPSDSQLEATLVIGGEAYRALESYEELEMGDKEADEETLMSVCWDCCECRDGCACCA